MGKRILLADDDEGMRALISRALVRDDYEVIECDHGECLLRMLRYSPKPIDLVISDIRMPFLSGLDVLKEMQGDLSMPPVILMTAFGEPRVHAEGMRLGAVATLDKPFDMDDLLKIVHEVAPMASVSR